MILQGDWFVKRKCLQTKFMDVFMAVLISLGGGKPPSVGSPGWCPHQPE